MCMYDVSLVFIGLRSRELPERRNYCMYVMNHNSSDSGIVDTHDNNDTCDGNTIIDICSIIEWKV